MSSSNEQPRLKVILIHGWGGTFADALGAAEQILAMPVGWHRGAFLLPRREGMVLRRILDDPEPDACMLAFQELALSRLLNASLEPTGAMNALEVDRCMEISEEWIRHDFERFGMPFSPALRRERARALERDAETRLAPVRAMFGDLLAILAPDGFPTATEAETRQVIRSYVENRRLSFDPLPLLDVLRGMHETGGDLDTVASATLYAYGLTAQEHRQGRTLEYGRGYRFAYVNYHEGLLHLQNLAPADVYMADIPIGALPDFENQTRALAAAGVGIARYEDHHPRTFEQRAMLERLTREGLIGHLNHCGPMQGAEPGADERQCAADLVYRSMIRSAPTNRPGASALAAAAHSEDFVEERNPLGMRLTGLIKGGICKIELAQALLDGVCRDDLERPLVERGWDALEAAWSASASEAEERLLESACIIETPRASLSYLPESASGETQRPSERASDPGVVRILVALAARNAPGAARLPVGKAISYYARIFPDLDYAFYCYGASLLVARRMNSADVTLNLGDLMPALGTEQDGGHAGAAVCRPERHAGYPRRLIGRVTASNFPAFVRYLSSRFDQLGFPIVRRVSVSSRSSAHGRGGGVKLLWITVLAIIAGAAIALLLPAFRHEAVRQTNQRFFPSLDRDTEPFADDRGEP